MSNSDVSEVVLEETQRYRERAITIIKARPGITPQSMATHLGVSYRVQNDQGKFPVNSIISRLLDWLRSHEDIQVLEPDKLHGSVRLYPQGFKLPLKQLFQPAREASLGECKTYKVPLEDLHKYTQQTVKPAIAPPTQQAAPVLATAEPEPIVHSTPDQEENMAIPARRATENVRAAIEDALTELLATGKPFVQQDVCQLANVGASTLHRHKDLLDKIKEAIATNRESKLLTRASSEVNVALQQQIQELEQRNRELREQLQAAQQQSAPPVAVSSLEIRLQEEMGFWQEQISQYRQQQKELELAIAKAQAKVEVLNDLIEREQVQAHAEGNGICKV